MESSILPLHERWRKSLRWKIALPALMVLLSALLMMLAATERSRIPRGGCGMGCEVPARIINSMINGPGFFFSNFDRDLSRLGPFINDFNRSLNYDSTKLPAIFIFWFLIGLAMDRRRNGKDMARQFPKISLCLFVLPAMYCGLIGGTFLIYSLSGGLSTFTFHPLYNAHIMFVGRAIWLVGLGIYFSRRAAIAYKILKNRAVYLDVASL